MTNIDNNVVNDFGAEWKKFNKFSDDEIQNIFEDYFHIFDFSQINKNSEGFDLGCGSGRWANVIAHKVKKLHCIDPAQDALDVCKKVLHSHTNCAFHLNSVDNIPLADNSMDFGYTLGVLHHVPNTQQAIHDCAKKLKTNAPFLIYLYYRFDNKPKWYYWLWKASDLLRKLLSKFPTRLKHALCLLITLLVYWPFSRLSKYLALLGCNVNNLPLSFYKDKSFYIQYNDAIDRFCTRLEKRFTKKEIKTMLTNAGLINIQFSDKAPYWVALGYKK